MLRALNEWLLKADSGSLENNPVVWLSRIHLVTPVLLVAVIEFFISLFLPLYVATAFAWIMTSLCLMFCIWVFWRQCIYFNYKLGIRKISKIYFFNLIMLTAIACVAMVTPLTVKSRVMSKIPQESQGVSLASALFSREMSMVYLFLLKDLRQDLPDLEQTGSYYNNYLDSVVDQSTDSRKQISTGQTRNDQLDYALFQLIKKYENAFALYDRDVMSEKNISNERFKIVVDRFDLTIIEPDFQTSKRILMDHMRTNKALYLNYADLNLAQNSDERYSRVFRQLAKCIIVEREINVLYEIINTDYIVFEVIAVFAILTISILITILSFWRIETVWVLLVLAAIVAVVFGLANLIKTANDGAVLLFVDLIFGIFIVFFSGFKRPENRVFRLRLWLVMVTNFLYMIAPFLFIITLSEFDIISLGQEYDYPILAVTVLWTLISHRIFIRYYTLLKYSPT